MTTHKPSHHLRAVIPSEPRARRLPSSEFVARPWRIHEVAPDFRVLDVWQLPTPGGAGELGVLTELFAKGAGGERIPLIARVLWSARWAIGKVMRWDGPQHGVGIRVPSLNARLPDDLRHAPIGPDLGRQPFTSVYLLRDEYAAEIANATCHGVLHIGWVRTEFDCWTAQLTVLVRPNGFLGRAYLAVIEPFRHRLFYPALMRTIERRWQAARTVPRAVSA